MMAPPRGKFDPTELTDVQKAFWSGLTDQRTANLWDAADFIAELSPDAREFLRRADKETIAELNANLEFYRTSKSIWKFLWIGGAALMGLLTAWKTIADYIAIKFK